MTAHVTSLAPPARWPTAGRVAPGGTGAFEETIDGAFGNRQTGHTGSRSACTGDAEPPAARDRRDAARPGGHTGRGPGTASRPARHRGSGRAGSDQRGCRFRSRTDRSDPRSGTTLGSILPAPAVAGANAHGRVARCPGVGADAPLGRPVRARPVGSGWSPDLTAPAPVVEGSKGNRVTVWRWAVVCLAAALIGALVGGGIVAASNSKDATTTVKEISAGPALLNGVTNIEAVIDKVLPAVVSIDATSPAPASPSVFGGSTGGEQEDQGTGMIITSNGEVVTNNHVISGATTITVTLFGSLKALPATLVDTDPTNDIALLQITNASNLPTVGYGDSDNVQVGDAVVAIGNALGLSAGTPTVTQGIISAKGRTVQASDSTGAVTETLTNTVQTDAAINPGNSGGPLVDSSGKVIGMNTAVASSADGTSQAQNIGFAIPSNKIEQELPELRNKTIPNPATSGAGYLGVSLETLTSELRSEYNFVPNQGAVVLQVE